MKIYVNFDKPKTLREFLQKFFNYDSRTGRGQSVKTFFDKDCTQIQCFRNKNRSVQDVLDCVSTYFPTVTLKKLLHELVTLDIPGMKFYPMWCGDIRRHVMCYWAYGQTSMPVDNGEDFSWAVILKEELGITTIQELYTYGKKS